MNTSDKPKPQAGVPEWLNYHHLRYFYEVAQEGGVARAAAKLRVSQPSISEQIRELERALGEDLFRRQGRVNRLTDAGQIVFGYAEEIFGLGRELLSAVKQRPGARALRFHVGVADSFPKLVTNDILKPVFLLPQPVHVICREGKMEELLVQLAAHRLDIVFSDEPSSSSTPYRTFNHPLGASGSSICAERTLAGRLRRGFPQSLHGAPALLPAENTVLRRQLERWFHEQGIQPQVVAECEDLALLKVMAAEGRGFIVLPTVAMDEATRRYHFELVGHAKGCRLQFHAITAERRLVHPAATAITSQVRSLWASSGKE